MGGGGDVRLGLVVVLVNARTYSLPLAVFPDFAPHPSEHSGRVYLCLCSWVE